MKLNPDNFPEALKTLIPMVEKWGIGDDFEREETLSKAGRQELEELIHCIDEISDEDLFGWLSGKESFNPQPTNEYVALTCLTMAIDSAKVKLKKKFGGHLS